MRLLSPGIGFGQNGTRFTKPETQLAEYTLALPNLELDAKSLLDPSGKRLAVPQVDTHAGIARFTAQHPCHFLHLCLIEAWRTACMFGLGQSGQSPILEMVHPIFNGTWGVSKQSCDFGASHALRHEQNAVKAVVVTRLFRALDLLLQAQHGGIVCDAEWWSHISSKSPQASKRKYL